MKVLHFLDEMISQMMLKRSHPIPDLCSLCHMNSGLAFHPQQHQHPFLTHPWNNSLAELPIPLRNSHNSPAVCPQHHSPGWDVQQCGTAAPVAFPSVFVCVTLIMFLWVPLAWCCSPPGRDCPHWGIFWKSSELLVWLHSCSVIKLIYFPGQKDTFF